MKIKRILSMVIAVMLCISSFSVFAYDAKEAVRITSGEMADDQSKENSALEERYADKTEVYYNDEILRFDVEPIIENDRTLVPFRAIFEAMGCAVYYTAEDGKQIVSARRANDNLKLTIGENKMYFNGKEIELDVPAKIKDSRTLVPLRAISEAFECEVNWQGETKTINIYPPMNAYSVSSKKIQETITDDEGNVLIETVAYYPVIENPEKNLCFDKINSDFKQDADKFIEEARERKEDALSLRKERGEDFTPFVYELTYEQTYRIWGNLSFVNHKYINVGGAHPTKIMESRTYGTSNEKEMSISDVLVEEKLDVSLSEYVTNLFVDKLKEIAPESAEVFTYDYVSEYLGYVQFYLTENSLVLYFDQGEITPYALGVISVEIPYNPELFHIDMRHNYEEEHVFEREYEKGYEWRVFDYSDDKLAVTEENTDYPPEEIYSEYYPVGLNKVRVKGIKKGNATLISAHVKKGEAVETATQIHISSFYVDENNMLTLVNESEGMYLIEKNELKEQDANVFYPISETLDIKALDNCKVSVSLEKGDAYVNDSGKMVMDLKVYSYEIYDMADVASLKENDVIVRRNEEIKVTEIERLETGIVRINGGDENGGFDLVSSDSTVYYEIGMNDTKSYYELGMVTLPVSVDFRYVDESDPDKEAKIYYPGDFLTDYAGIEYRFTPNNTSVVIENGTIIEMNRVYMP